MSDYRKKGAREKRGAPEKSQTGPLPQRALFLQPLPPVLAYNACRAVDESTVGATEVGDATGAVVIHVGATVGAAGTVGVLVGALVGVPLGRPSGAHLSRPPPCPFTQVDSITTDSRQARCTTQERRADMPAQFSDKVFRHSLWCTQGRRPMPLWSQPAGKKAPLWSQPAGKNVAR